MPAPQTFKNHGRFDPAFHFFLAPILIFNLGRATYTTIHQWPRHHSGNLWWIVMSVALIVIAGKVRGYALQTQDRVIRVEERLRFAALLSPTELAASNALAMKQYIALRFASDAEVPALIKRTLVENLTPKQIKQSIVAWRPDYDRV